jgi:hypothetical protein
VTSSETDDSCEAEACVPRALLPEFLIEVHRLDLHHWGNIRTAAVVRCVAADNGASGRPAKVNKVANVLGFGVATVHSHLAALARWPDPDTGARRPKVERVAGGYSLTAEGWASLRAWSGDVERVRTRLAQRASHEGSRPDAAPGEPAAPFPFVAASSRSGS